MAQVSAVGKKWGVSSYDYTSSLLATSNYAILQTLKRVSGVGFEVLDYTGMFVHDMCVSELCISISFKPHKGHISLLCCLRLLVCWFTGMWVHLRLELPQICSV